MSAESNARDHSRRIVQNLNESFEAGHEAAVNRGIDRGPAPYIDWEDIKTLRTDYGYSWQEIEETLEQRQIAEDLYEAGDTTYGQYLWDMRDEDFPEAMYYYHGIFG